MKARHLSSLAILSSLIDVFNSFSFGTKTKLRIFVPSERSDRQNHMLFLTVLLMFAFLCANEGETNMTAQIQGTES